MNDVKALWDERAALGDTAGTQDRIAKALEIEAIAKHVKDGMDVLDVGCGNGETAFALAGRHGCKIYGLDSSEPMIEVARQTRASAHTEIRDRTAFGIADIEHIQDTYAAELRFDLVYTERCLINLRNAGTQLETIVQLNKLVKPGGTLLLCECSLDGLYNINANRIGLGLERIAPPWHDQYLPTAAMKLLCLDGQFYEEMDCFSGTYYFLSRIVNAMDAKQQGVEPDYNAPVNKLALRIPHIPMLNKFAQVRLWTWRRR